MVNVRHIIFHGLYPRCCRRYATREVRVLVLPEPGGARICRTLEGDVTADRCAAFNPSKIESIDSSHVYVCHDVCEASEMISADAKSHDMLI